VRRNAADRVERERELAAAAIAGAALERELAAAVVAGAALLELAAAAI
jgi:hypothetical protein